MNNDIILLPNGDFEVKKDAPSMEFLESNKPEFNPDDKAAKKLFCEVQDACDALYIAKLQCDAAIGRAVGMTREQADDAHAQAYDEYSDLVDIVVEATHGSAPAFYTDPYTYELLGSKGYPVTGMTYNQMAELEGSLAFGS